jgi:nucleotide-binding universal stress UspA family protein
MQYAFELFKDNECTFFVMHSIESGMSAPSTGVKSKRASEIIIKSRIKEANEGLARILKRIDELPENNKHIIEPLLVKNNFISAVHSAAEQLNIDVVIVGTKGASGVKEVVIGSNTGNLIKKLSFPIIAVPSKAKTKDLDEIGFATDYSIKNYEDGIELLKEIAIANNSKISVVNIVNKGAELSSDELENKSNLTDTLNELDLTFYTLTDIPIETGIRAFSESRKLGMLCVITKKHSFFEKIFSKSHSKSISHNISVPLIVFDQKAFNK